MRCCDPSVCLSVPGSWAMVTKTLIAAGSQTVWSAVLHPYIHLFNSSFPGLPGWASTRKVKTIWILHCQMTVSGSGISLAVHKSAPSSRQITTPAPHHSVFYRPDALPAAQPTASKHWRLGLGFIQLPCLLTISVWRKNVVDLLHSVSTFFRAVLVYLNFGARCTSNSHTVAIMQVTR